MDCKTRLRIELALRPFVDEISVDGRVYYTKVTNGGKYKWAAIYRYGTHRFVCQFRGRTYDDLTRNIELAWSAHRAMKSELYD